MDEEDDFAFWGVGLEVGEDFGGGAAVIGFEFFGEFAGDAGFGVGGDFGEDFEGSEEAVWGFEEEVGFAGGEGVGEGGAAFAGFDGEEAAEVEGVAGEAGADECGDDGGGSGEDFEWGIGLDAGLDEAVSWVGDAGHAGIGDDGDGFTCAGGGGEFGGAAGFVVFVKGDEGFAGDAVVGEEGAGVAGVFAGDAVGGFEDLDGAQGEVGEVADGGGDDDDAAAGFHGDGVGGRCTGRGDGGRRNCG